MEVDWNQEPCTESSCFKASTAEKLRKTYRTVFRPHFQYFEQFWSHIRKGCASPGEIVTQINKAAFR